MKIIHLRDIKGTDREVNCPKGDFVSNRFLIESDGMGYSITKTLIPKGVVATWHYKNHLESCYCISGFGRIKAYKEDFYHNIMKDCLYVLDKNDRHEFEALEDVELICVFNPALKGKEVHKEDGSYE